MNASEKQLTWVKLHLGPLSLNEKVSAGYASWSFEETRSVRRKTASKSLEVKRTVKVTLIIYSAITIVLAKLLVFSGSTQKRNIEQKHIPWFFQIQVHCR